MNSLQKCQLRQEPANGEEMTGKGRPGYNKGTYKHSDETRKKISNSLRSDEVKKKISDSKKSWSKERYEKVYSSEWRENLSIAHSGKKLSEDHKKKISISHKGKKLSDTHKASISSANKIALKGRKLSETHKINLRKPRKFPRTDQHKKNLGTVLKIVWNSPEKKEFARDRCIHMIQEGILGRSNLESEFKDILVQRNILFEEQKRIGNHVIDFFLIELGIAIDVDGDYWHARKPFEELNAAQRRNAIYRAHKLTECRRNNIDLWIISESQIKTGKIELRLAEYGA
jgi:hypothetical protein